MVFVADDLGAWLVALLADAGRKKLTTWMFGDEQQRALYKAAAAAIELTAKQLAPPGGEGAEHMAMAVSEVFGGPTPGVALARSATVLQALQAGIAEKLAVLDNTAVTGTDQSWAEMFGVAGGVLAETLAHHLVREIMFRGSGGGPLTPLADQLNQDRTYLQGQQIEEGLAQLADLVKALAQAGSTPVVPGKPVRLLPRLMSLAGREDLLTDLDTRLTSGDGPGPRIVALHGLGGAGKTSVAVEYAHRHLAEVGVVWQFSAEDTTVLAGGFTDLAAQLGIGSAAGGGNPVAAVHSALAASPGPWLLIFDNAADLAAVQAFLPPAGTGRVLITSRNALWPPGQAVEVPVLSTVVAAGFLVERIGDLDEEAARDLAEAVGGLPLALEQAAAYIQASGSSLAGYLASFRRRRADLLARGKLPGYPGTVATTWALAFSYLEQSAAGAAGLLRLLAFCAPEVIPLRLLLKPRPGLPGQLPAEVADVLSSLLDDELAADDAVAALREYSLVRPGGDGAVSVHRLVQAVTADQMPEQSRDAWRQAAAAVIEAAIPADTQQPETWPVCAALLPHALAALDLTSGAMWRIAHYLGNSGSYPAARDLWQLIADAHAVDKAHGPEHRYTLTARANLARWTGQAGDVAGARDLYAALLPIEERALGSEDPETLNARGNLAYFTGAAGDAAGARDQYAALLPIEERALGPQHRETLTARGNLARWTGAAGDVAGARDLYAALLPIEERALGSEDPETLTSGGNLAYFTGLAGDAAGARDLCAALLPISQRVLGPEHPETLAARGNLARWTETAGDVAGARDLYAALLPISQRVLGPEHPSTLITLGNLASATGLAGDVAGARDLYAALLPISQRVLGPEHPETLAARANLARWTGLAGDAAGARDLYAALLPISQRVLGPEHPSTLITLGNLASTAGLAGDVAGARDLCAALLPIIGRVSGPEHPDTLNARANLANWTGAAGDVAGARDQYAALLPIEERALGPQHRDTLTARANLAYWTEKAGHGVD